MKQLLELLVKALRDPERSDIFADDFLDPNMPQEIVDAELRELGVDPDECAERGVAFIENLRAQHSPGAGSADGPEKPGVGI